jgi:hypothetical protein
MPFPIDSVYLVTKILHRLDIASYVAASRVCKSWWTITRCTFHLYPPVVDAIHKYQFLDKNLWDRMIIRGLCVDIVRTRNQYFINYIHDLHMRNDSYALTLSSVAAASAGAEKKQLLKSVNKKAADDFAKRLNLQQFNFRHY